MSVRIYSLNEIVSLIIRRRWLILIPFAIGGAAAPVLARYAPERYRSDALIVVIPQQVPDNYVKPTVSQTVEERLPSITDQILSRTKLQRIIEEMDLYKAERARTVMQDVVEKMRQDVTTSPASKNIDSFRVSYVSDNAETARKVTERLVGLYIDQNSQDRVNQADHTSEFLDAALADAKRRLIDQETKLEDYKKSHAGQMPTQLQGNLQAIQNANVQLQALFESMNRAQQSRLLIERQIADAQSVPMTVPSSPAAGVDPSGPLTTAQQLDLARARRGALLQTFTSEYPPVMTLDRQIADLVKRLESETPVSAPEKPLTAAEVAQQKRIGDLQAELAVLDYQLGNNRTDEKRLKKDIADYQAKVDAVPSRESELVELTRDYTTLVTAYNNLRMKSEDSTIAANLERKKIGEQFSFVDEASRPERPYNQVQRRAVMASGAAGGLVLGLLVVGLLEFRDSSFRDANEVIAALSLPVLASIPAMSSDRERQKAKWRSRLMDVAGTAVLLSAGVVLVLWRLRF